MASRLLPTRRELLLGSLGAAALFVADTAAAHAAPAGADEALRPRREQDDIEQDDVEQDGASPA